MKEGFPGAGTDDIIDRMNKILSDNDNKLIVCYSAGERWYQG